MRFARVVLLDACAVALLGGAPAVAGQYRVVPMAVPGAKFTVPVALGAGNEVVGFYEDRAGQEHAFVWAAHRYTTVGLTASELSLVGINHYGVAVGYYSTHTGMSVFTYDIHSGKVDTAFTGPSFAELEEGGINGAGVVVGTGTLDYRHLDAYEGRGGAVRIIARPPGHFTSYGAIGINDSGMVAGNYGSGGKSFGFTFQGGVSTPVEVAGSTGVRLTFINDAGTVGGSFTDAAGMVHGFTKTGSTVAMFDYPGAAATQVAGVTRDGRVVGSWQNAGGVGHAFLWSGGTYQDLGGLVPKVASFVAEATNEFGSVLGYVAPSGNKAGVSFLALCTPGQFPCTP